MSEMYRRAIVRPPAENFANGLTTVDLGEPDVGRALAEHEAYCGALEALVAAGSMAAAREKGLLRQEGKEYVVQDGDVMLFKFNV